jgi:squalene cyclase
VECFAISLALPVERFKERGDEAFPVSGRGGSPLDRSVPNCSRTRTVLIQMVNAGVLRVAESVEMILTLHCKVDRFILLTPRKDSYARRKAEYRQMSADWKGQDASITIS